MNFSKTSNIIASFNDRKSKPKYTKATRAGLITIPFFIFCIILVGGIILRETNLDVREDTVNSLQNLLNSTHTNIKEMWAEEHFIDASLWAENPIIINNTKELLRISSNRKALINSPALLKIRKLFKENLKRHDALGIFIIAPNHISIASMRDKNTGTINLIAKKQKERLNNVFKGKNQLITPLISDVPLQNKNNTLVNNYPTMFVAVPIYDNDRVIAALSIRMNPLSNFSQIPKTIRIGKTGETYFFDKEGMLISESRFNDKLVSIGLLKTNNYSLLKLKITDPGGNLLKGYKIKKDKKPFTYAVQQAFKNKSGNNTKSYRDYRGVKVLGAWLWDEELGIGIITEINEAEALRPYRKTAYITILVLLFTILSTLVFIYLILRSQRRSIFAVAQSEKYLRTILSNAADAIITINEKGIIEEFNKAAERIFQYTAKEIIGKNVKIIVNMHDRKNHDQYLKNYIKTGKAKIIGSPREANGIKKDGTIVPIRLAVNELFFGDKRKFVGILADITEARKAQTDLLISEERYRKTFDQSPICIANCDIHGNFIKTNQEFCQLFGYTEKELQQKKLNDITHPENLDNTNELISNILRSENNSITERKKYIKKDGVIILADTSFYALKDKDGQILNLITIVKDITQQLKADKKIRTTN